MEIHSSSNIIIKLIFFCQMLDLILSREMNVMHFCLCIITMLVLHGHEIRPTKLHQKLINLVKLSLLRTRGINTREKQAKQYPKTLCGLCSHFAVTIHRIFCCTKTNYKRLKECLCKKIYNL